MSTRRTARAHTRITPSLKAELRARHGRGVADAIRAAIAMPPAQTDWRPREAADTYLEVRLTAAERGQLEAHAAAHGLSTGEALLRLAEVLAA